MTRLLLLIVLVMTPVLAHAQVQRCAGRCGDFVAEVKLARREFRFGDADRWLDSARAVAPRDVTVRTLFGDVLVASLEFERADSVYRAVIADDITYARPLLGLARIAFFRDDRQAAESLLDRIAARDSLDADAYLLYAAIDRDAQQLPKLASDVAKALIADPRSAGAHGLRGNLLREHGDVNGAYHELITAIEIDPYSDVGHIYLGNGTSTRSFRELPTELDSAARLFRAHDYPAALHAYLDITRAYPELGVAHYGVQLAEQALRDERIPAAQEALARFHARETPAEPHDVRSLFPGYDGLESDVRKVIVLATSPLASFLPALLVRHATFDLLPFDEPLWKLSGSAGLRGTRTFDYRLWDDVKGQGGLHAVAGEQAVRDAAYGRFNTLAHEFMHQVHVYAMTSNERAEVTRLYNAAMREHRTLDYYAASNEREYVAQAYEAFVSDAKLPNQKSTAGNTRIRLKATDPEMFDFLERITGEDRKPAR